MLQEYQNKKEKKLLVDYFSNRNAWMVIGVFEIWLKVLDQKMRFHKGKNLFFLDTAISQAKFSLKILSFNFLLPTQHLRKNSKESTERCNYKI